MFLLNCEQIKNYISRKEIDIHPACWEERERTCYRFRIGGTVECVGGDIKGSNITRLTSTTSFTFIPGCIYRIESLETFKLSERIQGFVTQTTNLALEGLQMVHGGGVDPEFAGKLNFLLKNVGCEPRYIKEGDYIGKLYFYEISDSVFLTKYEAKDFYDWQAERRKILKK